MFFGIEPGPGEGHFQKLLHRVGLPGRHHIIVRLVLLEHPPHRLHVLGRVPPVPLRLQVSEIHLVLQASLDPGHGPGDFAGHKRFSPPRTFVVEENPARGVQTVALAVVHRDPVRIDLGGGIGTARVKRSGFILGHRLDQAVHLGAGGLVKTGLWRHLPHGVEKSDRANGGDIAGELRDIEADPHVALGGQIVNLLRLGFPQDLNQRTRITEIAVMQEQAGSFVMAILVNWIDPFGVETGGAADDAVDFVPLPKEQLRQVGAVLSSDPGDKGAFRHGSGLFDQGLGPVVEFLGQADIQFTHPAHIVGG